jgi:hypothetical protein
MNKLMRRVASLPRLPPAAEFAIAHIGAAIVVWLTRNRILFGEESLWHTIIGVSCALAVIVVTLPALAGEGRRIVRWTIWPVPLLAFLLATPGWERWREQLIRNDPARATATVIETKSAPRRRVGDRHYVRVEFKAQGGTYTSGWLQVPYADRVGLPIRVRYNAADPRVVDLVRTEKKN